MRLPTLCLTLLILTACRPAASPRIVTSMPTAAPTVRPSPLPATETPLPAATPVPATLPPPPRPTKTAIQPAVGQFQFPTAPLPLSAYPRPPNDNGLGVHWSTHLYAQSGKATSYFVSELRQMNIKWVKLLVDGTAGREYDHTIKLLVEAGIMPVVRIYQQCNTPYNPQELEAMVRHYVKLGVYYFETYNEPNQPGEPGGWCNNNGEPQPEYLAQIWADAARTIYRAGGYPGLPSFFAPDQKLPDWRNSFFYRFFDALRSQGNQHVLYFSWAAIHNYTINHPPTYPFDEVNQTGRPLTGPEIDRYNLTPAQVANINLNRAVAGILKRRLLTPNDAARLNLPPEKIAEINQGFSRGKLMGFTLYDDSTGFFHFMAYRNQFFNLFGFNIPLISTEGGATKGSAEDPRYPPVNGQTVADWTLWTASYMLNDAPDYYFAATTWLLAQHALDYNEPVWEKDAWYHDRQGSQEPVVNALKNRPNLHQARLLCFEAELRALAPRGAKAQAKCRRTGPRPAPVPLSSYPRPPNDNGRGVHWPPTTQPIPPEVVDYFVPELRAMNIKWVKLLQDDLPEVTHRYLIEQLVANNIEPVLRVYKPFNEPYRYLPELAAQATGMGVHYFELYNEPNLSGPAGGWREGEAIDLERIVELWILAARDVHAAGGHPGLPPLAGGGTIDDMLFLRGFLDGLRARGQTGLLAGAWLPVHNYFLNHPLNYPADPVNVSGVPLTGQEIAARSLTPAQVQAINQARRNARLPREQGGFWMGNTIDEDSNAFLKFQAYANIFYDRFGYYLPVISTEGGAITGAAEDPRYPPVTEEDLTARTLAAYHAILDDAPPYFFAQTAWLLANQAGGHTDARFEHAAWYKDRAGTVLPVVAALKADPRKNEARQPEP